MLAKDGEIIGGRYRLKGMLGEGGFSEVHRGVDDVLEREVAVKLMNLKKYAPPGMNKAQVEQDITDRFLNEARVVARLKDPATITLFDFGSQPNGMLYMVLELIEGSTLRAILNAHGKLDVFSAVRVLTQTLESLREAHIHGLLHRDIKPENIMIFKHIEDPWCVRLIDFGIAKGSEDSASAMTAAGILTGTLRYVPPERMKQQPVSPASDLYSLGCVMYFALTGFEIYRDARQAIEIIRAQGDSQSVELPADLQIPDALRQVVDRLLDKDLTRRYGSAQQVLDDLGLLDLELQIARRGFGIDDLKSAAAMTQAIPAVGIGLDESSAATIPMSSIHIPGSVSQTSDKTIPVSMAHVTDQDVRRATHPGLRPVGQPTGPQGMLDPLTLTGPRSSPDPRLSTAPQPLPTGPQFAPQTPQSTLVDQQALQAPSTSIGDRLAALDRNQKFLLGFLLTGAVFGGFITLIAIILVFVTR